eukprot:c25247_g2_i1 orf=1627-2145(+)
MLHMKNGRNLVIQTGKTLVTRTAAAVVDCPFNRSVIDADAASRPVNEQRLDNTCEPAIYTESVTNCKVGGVPPVFLSGFPVVARTSASNILSSKLSVVNSCDKVKKRHSQSVSQEGGWSPSDDLEWLFLHSKHLPSKNHVKTCENEGTSQVWANAVHLPSVDMYALPYVIPI